jgi:enamine deaminase RidA (YjgF/YER057c/UK114 family)
MGLERKHINPKTLFPSVGFGFSQAVTTKGGKFVHVAGQTAWDTELNIVGAGDLAAQGRQALENVKLALEAAGATLADVIRTRIYVVNYKPEHVQIIGALNKEFFPGDTPPVSTLLGVQSLAVPDFLIEIEVTAVVDD